MKKIFLVGLVLLMIFGIAGCNKETYAPIPDGSPIIGKWNISSYIKNGVSKTISPSDYMQFNSDNTGIHFEDGKSNNFGYTFSNGNLLFVDKSNGGYNPITYSIKKLDSHNLDLYLETTEIILTK